MTTEQIMIGISTLILIETTYLSYRSWKVHDNKNIKKVFVDTSVLMDGRIVPIAEAGFIPGVLVVPRSVVAELQLLADQADPDKRERARKGLDVIQTLQQLDTITVEVMQDGRALTGVDDKLLELAKKYDGVVCTIDFNLNKVAKVEGIAVLNVNELAKNLRIQYVAGDKLKLELAQKGQGSGQAIGHVEDGTMVVVEKAHKSIGKVVEVEVIRSLQTDAGRMLFARLVADTSTIKNPERSLKVFAKKAMKSQQKTKTQGRKHSDTRQVSDDANTENTRKKTQGNKSTNSHNKKPYRKQQRRSTPEDAMVELANRK